MDVRKEDCRGLCAVVRAAGRYRQRRVPEHDALTKTSYAVTHTYMVLERLAALLSVLKDAETGQRGFVITGDEAYLEPYVKARTRSTRR